MVWKPKEKELTPEEAIALAKQELAPFWIGAEPQLAAVKTSNGVALFPLETHFANRARLMIYVDLMDFSMMRIAQFVREWQHRYSPHGLQILTVVEARSTELRVPAVVTRQLKKLGLPGIAVIDQDRLFAQALGAHDFPFFSLLFHKQTVFAFGARDWQEKAELALQQHLRQSDPGLPLPPPYRPDRRMPQAVGAIDFGRGSATEFPAPGFRLMENGLGAGAFSENITAAPRLGSLRPFAISGTWAQDADRIMTSDASAGISFTSPGREVALIARALSNNNTSRIVAEVNGNSVIDAFRGADISADEEGNTSVPVGALGSYEILTLLGSDSRTVTLRFPHAGRVPVALYGVRFGD